MTRTLLAVNPSHATALEQAFWTELAGHCAAAGWRLVQVACRRIPDLPDADTFVMPARLAELARAVPAVDRPPPWLSDEDIARHVEWEHRRWALPLQNPELRNAVVRLANVVDEAITDIRPAIVLTTNKIDHPCAFARRAAHFRGVPVVGLVERSPFESIWFEPDGLFRESTVWEPGSPWRSTTVAPGFGEQLVERLRVNPAGFRSAEVSRSTVAVDDVRRPIFFLPFDNVLWTGWSPRDHPQGDVDYPLLRDPSVALEAVTEQVRRLGGALLVKPHPSCVETAKLFVPPGASIVDASIESLLAAADVTVAFNTKLAFVSLAAGVPTVTLAENPAAAGGHTRHWSQFATLGEAFEGALDRSLDPRAADVARFFGQLERGHFYAPTSTTADGSRGPEQLLRDLIRACGDLGEPAAASVGVAMFCQRLTSGPAPTPCVAAPRTRPRVVLAADRLVQPHVQSSGIARYGWEMVHGIEADGSRELFVLVEEPDGGWQRGSAPLFDRLGRLVGDRLIMRRRAQPRDSILERLGAFAPRDVVHSIHLPLPPASVTGSAARVLTIHDVLHLTRPDLNVGSRRPTIDHIVKSIDATTDVVICDSAHTRRDLITLGTLSGDRIHTISLGVTPLTPDPSVATRRVPPNWRGFIVTMLQPEPRKNCAAVLEAAATMLTGDEMSGIGLVAVGAVSAIRFYGDELARIDRNRVVTVADIDDHELHSLLSAALCFVYPSLYEGFGLPPLEAMAAGCPVIVVPNSSLVEVVGDAGVYAHTGTAEELARAMRLLCSSARLRAALSAQGRIRANRLSWRSTVGETLALYDRLTADKEKVG